MAKVESRKDGDGNFNVLPAVYVRTILMGYPYYCRLYKDPNGRLWGMLFRKAARRFQGTFWGIVDVKMIESPQLLIDQPARASHNAPVSTSDTHGKRGNAVRSSRT